MTYPPQGYGPGGPTGAQSATGGWSQPSPQSAPQLSGHPQQYPYGQAPSVQRRPGIDPRITYTGALVTALGAAGFFFGFGALWSESGESLSLFEAGATLYPVLLLLGGSSALAAVWTRNTFGLAGSIFVPLAASLTMLANLQGVADIGSLGWGYWMIFSLGWIMSVLSLCALLLALGRIGAPRRLRYAPGGRQPAYPQQTTGYPVPAPAPQTAPPPGETVTADRAGVPSPPQPGAQNPTAQDPVTPDPSTHQQTPPQPPPAAY